MRLFLALLLLPFTLFAGQSLDATTASGIASFRPTGKPQVTGGWRVEFHLHDMVYTAETNVTMYRFNSIGGYFSFIYASGSGGSYSINYTDQYGGDTFFTAGAASLQISTPADPRLNMLVRIQRDPDNMRYTMEVWDADGSNYFGKAVPIQTLGPRANDNLTEITRQFGKLGFLRVSTDVVAMNSKPPTTAETGNWASWKFDGNGTDDGPNPWTINVASSTFAATTGQGAFAFPQTGTDADSLVELPLRAGYPSTIYGDGSFSMADSSNAVTCLWRQIEHEAGEPLTSTVTFSDRTACNPTVTGLVFGPYKFRLTVTDTNGAQGTADVEAGAVAWDDNCVVIYPDERLYTLIGPQLANGCSPWAYAENRFDAQSRALADDFAVNGGVVEIPALKSTMQGITLAGTVYWTDTGAFRTVYGIGTNFLDVFCGGQVGPATGFSQWMITHAPDPANYGDVRRTIAHYVMACVSDTEIYTRPWLEKDRGFTFASPGGTWHTWDHAERPDKVQGTVYAANGSTTVYGTGTDLQNTFCSGGTTPIASADIRIQSQQFTVVSASNASPIVIETNVAHQFASGNGVTIFGVGGNTAANQGLAYVTVLTSTTFSLYSDSARTTPIAGNGAYTSGGIVNAYGGMSTHRVASCVSATEITITTPFTQATINSPGVGYLPRLPNTDGGIGGIGGWGLTGSNTTQWYDNAGAFYRHYYGSGWYRSLKAARYLIWANPHNPYNYDWTGLWETQFSPMLAAILDKEKSWQVNDPWPWMVGRTATADNNFANAPGDQRSTSYAAWYIANLALYHPVEATRNAMKDKLIDHYNLQVVPYQDPDSGGYYSMYDDNETRIFTVANGSTTMTLHSGAALPSNFCGVRWQPGGTISIDADDVTVTGTGTNFVGAGGRLMVLRGTYQGAPYVTTATISSTPTPTATSLTLYHPWRGDDGSITDWWIIDRSSTTYPPWAVFMLEQTNSAGAIPTPRVIDLDEAYYCTWVDANTVTLSHPYQGDTSAGNIYRRQIKEDSTPTAVYRQPFMDSMKASSFYLAYKALQGYNDTVANGYLARMENILDAMYNDRDQVSNGQQYFRMSPLCKPYRYDIPTPCDGTLGVGGNNDERDYWIEVFYAMAQYYLEAGDATDLSRFDQVYTWVYGRPGWATPIASDGYYVAWLEGIGPKKHGQGNGVGGGATWPAARLGGPAAANNKTLTVQVASPLAYGDRIRITVTNASGVAVTNTCVSNTCSVTSDFRAGGQTVLIEYLDVGLNVLSTSSQNMIVN